MEGAGCAAASASPPRAWVMAALVGHRHDSRARTRCARRAVAGALWIASTRPEPMSTPETSAPRPSGELARYALTGPLEGFDAVLVELNFRPGVSAPEHRHPGFILGYVVDGQMRTAINHEPDQIVPAGGTFFEPHWRPSHGVRLREPRCARAHRGIPGGPHRQPADGARDEKERTMKLLTGIAGARSSIADPQRRRPHWDADALHGHPPAGVRGGIGGHLSSGR